MSQIQADAMPRSFFKSDYNDKEHLNWIRLNLSGLVKSGCRVNNLGHIRASKPRDHLNFQKYDYIELSLLLTAREAGEVTNMFTRASTPQVRWFTRLSASLFGAPWRAIANSPWEEGWISCGMVGGRTNKTFIRGTRARGRSIFRFLPRACPRLLSPHFRLCFTTTLPSIHLLSYVDMIPQSPRRFPRRHRVHTCVIRTRMPGKESVSSYQLAIVIFRIYRAWTFAIISGITSDVSWNFSVSRMSHSSFQFRPSFPQSYLARSVYRKGKRGIRYAWEKRNENSRSAEGGGEISISR